MDRSSRARASEHSRKPSKENFMRIVRSLGSLVVASVLATACGASEGDGDVVNGATGSGGASSASGGASTGSAGSSGTTGGTGASSTASTSSGTSSSTGATSASA